MPFAIISLIIIIIALIIAAYIVVQKFPHIAALDVEEIPEKKQKEKKKEILDRRAKEKVSAIAKNIKGKAKDLPVQEWISKLKKQTKKGASFVEEKYTKLSAERTKKKAKQMDDGELSETIGSRLRKAEQFAAEDRYEEAEQAFIDVISMDNKHAGAYRGLGKVFAKAGEHAQAEQTFTFLLKLTPQDDTIYVKLGQNAQAAGDKEKAITYYEKGIKANPGLAIRHFEMGSLYRANGQWAEAFESFSQAVALESENPRYLDALLDSAIEYRKIKEAKEVLRKLKKVNPENKKIEVFEKRIVQIR